MGLRKQTHDCDLDGGFGLSYSAIPAARLACDEANRDMVRVYEEK
jgi:hypothetical protein